MMTRTNTQAGSGRALARCRALGAIAAMAAAAGLLAEAGRQAQAHDAELTYARTARPAAAGG